MQSSPMESNSGKEKKSGLMCDVTQVLSSCYICMNQAGITTGPQASES